MTWLRSNWLRGALLPVLLAVMRASWLWLWLELMRGLVAPSVAAPLLPLPLIASFSLAGLATARRLLSHGSHLTAARLIEAVAGIAVIALVIWLRLYSGSYAPWDTRWLADLGTSLVGWEGELPGALVLMPFLIYLWLRGVLDAASGMFRDDVWGAFAAGFAAIALAGVVAVAGGRGLPAGAYEVVFLFFGAGLAAVALASLETTSNSAVRRGEDRLRIDRYWLASVGSVIIVMLLIGLLVSVLITPQMVARLLRWTTGILDVLGLILYYVLLVLAYVVFFFLEPLINWAQRLLSGGREEESQPLEMPDFQQTLEDVPKGEAALPPWISNLLPWLGLAVALLVIGLAFALALRRFQQAKDDETIETRESILSASLLHEQLLGLARRLRRPRPHLAHPFLSLDGEQEARRVVRSAYQGLLAATGRLGQARRRDQTPTEYGDALEQRWPQQQKALDTLTAAYLKARFAQQPPSAAEADAAKQAWDDIQPELAPTDEDAAEKRGDKR